MRIERAKRCGRTERYVYGVAGWIWSSTRPTSLACSGACRADRVRAHGGLSRLRRLRWAVSGGSVATPVRHRRRWFLPDYEAEPTRPDRCCGDRKVSQKRRVFTQQPLSTHLVEVRQLLCTKLIERPELRRRDAGPSVRLWVSQPPRMTSTSAPSALPFCRVAEAEGSSASR